MKLKDALDQQLLRAVKLQTNNYPEPYKGTEPVPYKTLKDETVALINVQAKFIYTKNARLLDRTVQSKTGMSLIEIGDATVTYDTIKKPARNQFMVVKLTDKLLDTDIITWTEAQKDVHNLTFDELMTQVLLDKGLSDVELLSLALDPRLSLVLPVNEQIKLTEHAVTLEIMTGRTPRGRLFKQAFHDMGRTPKAIALFSDDERRILEKAVVLL